MALSKNSALDLLRESHYSKYNKYNLQGSTKSPASKYNVFDEDEEEKKKNKKNNGLLGEAVGDFFEGVGYLGHKTGLGFINSVEGTVDYISSGIAKLFGNDDRAEQILENDWLNYDAADDWFNPGQGWKVAGDVASGVGTSLFSVGAGILTGGVGTVISAGLSGAGNAAREVYKETGEYGLDEFAYASTAGALEGGLEAVLGAGAKWAKSLAKSLGGSIAKNAAKTTGKIVATSAKNTLKKAGKEMISEGLEEAITEWVSPYIKRATYDKNAANATTEEILYSGFVGGLSALVMSGGVGAINQAGNIKKGNAIVNDGKASSVTSLAEALVEVDPNSKYNKAISDIYNKISPAVNSGGKLTLNQRRALGELRQLETEAVFQPVVKRSAISVINSAEAVAARLNEYGIYKIVDGKLVNVKDSAFESNGAEVRDITAEDITRGIVNPSDAMAEESAEKSKKKAKEEYKNSVEEYRASIDKALATNEVLRFVAASDAAGRIMMNAKETERAAAFGSKIKSQEELSTFVSESNQQEKKALARELGIEDLDSVTFEEFNEKAKEYRDSGKAAQFRENIRINEQLQRMSADDAKSMPRQIELEDGQMQRYSDETNNIAVLRKGNKYIVHDFVNQTTSKPLSKKYLDKLLSRRREIKKTQKSDEKALALYEEKLQKKYDEEAPIRESKERILAEMNARNEANRKKLGKELSFPQLSEASEADMKSEKPSLGSSILSGISSAVDTVGNLFKRSGVASEAEMPAREATTAKAAVNKEANTNAAPVALDAQGTAETTDATSKVGIDAKRDTAATKRFAESIEAYRNAESIVKEKVADYESMDDAKKKKTVSVMKNAIVSGLSVSDATMYARVEARSGIDIVFDREACRNGDEYAAGFYDPENNRIVINPRAQKKHVSLLIHELSHAIRSYVGKDNKIHYLSDKNAQISDELWQKVKKHYADQKVDVSRLELMLDEASAYYAEEILGTDAALDLLLGKKKTLKEKILSFFKGAIKKYFGDEVLSKEARKFYRSFKKMFDAFAEKNQSVEAKKSEGVNENVESINKNVDAEKIEAKENAKRFAAEDVSNITVGMSDSERATILKSKKIKPAEIKQADYTDFDWDALERNRKSAVEKPLIKKLRELGYLRTYRTESIDVSFDFTAGGLRKSMNSQVSDYGGTLADLAKVVMNMQQILDSSVLLEIHKDKAKGTLKENQRLLQTYVLMSAFAEGAYITPVQFEVKQYIDNENRLYLAVALSKIEKTSVMDDTVLTKGERTRLLPAFDYSISDFIKKINPSDENFFKYIPDELLTDEQKDAKASAIEKENAKYRRFSTDDSYLSAVERGDMKNAQRMVDEAAKNPDIRYSVDEDIIESPTLGNVAKSRFDEPKPKLKEKIKVGFTSAKDKLYIETVDELYGVEKYLKKFGGRKDAEAFVQQVRASETIAQTMIGNVQYDIVSGDGTKLGEGISKIFKPYKMRKIENQFNDYLLHQLNVDRMTLSERTNGEVDNKPVFGKNEKRDHDITAEESKKIIAAYDKKYSSFKADAEKVWSYSKNLLNMRVKAGLVSQEAADLMNKYYPHYVPSFREDVKSVGSSAVKNDSQLGVNSTIKKAKGGSADIYSIEESIAAQTRQAIKAMEINKMANAVYDAAIKSGDDSYVIAEEVETEKNTDPDKDIDVDLIPKNNQIVFFKDGKRIEMSVAKEIFDGFKGVTSGSVPDMFVTRVANRGVNAFKNLVTSYSPAFSVRNFVKDIQDALINSKHVTLFGKNIVSAMKGIASNDALWQQYLAHGGYASTVFDGNGFTNGIGGRGFEALQKISEIDGNSFKKLSAAMKNILVSVGNANAFVEQVTRFAEFRASIEAGDSIQAAINNSADVTTNFSRHGKSVKVLNATFIPFLNASVQGFDKLLRVITGPFKEKSLSAIAILLAKALAIGIAPQILNMIMNGDDEEYYDLTDEVRENYFLIKVGDQFIKIPRGRAAAAFGGIANRIGNEMRGDDFDVAGYLTSLKDNVTPVESFSRNILSPFKDLATNTTWYGGEIEGRQFDNVRPSQRYDESTSSIAIWIGDKINYSPKKIHYLMDQYSGVIGDFLLPATTKKAEKDYLSANFLIDSTTNNKLSNDFYKLYDDAMYASEEGDMTAYYQLRHLNDVKESVSKLYKEINEIQNSDLKNAEKLQQVRTLRVLINNIYRTAAVDYAAYTQAINATDGMFDDSDDSGKRDRYVAITQMMYGSEKALEEYNKNVYEKSTLFNKAGISYDTYYEYYFGVRDIESDVDKNGDVISGSKKKKVEAAIKALGVDRRERLLLTMASGYSVSDSEKRSIASYIRSLNLPEDEFKELAEACGFKVKNGKIQL